MCPRLTKIGQAKLRASDTYLIYYYVSTKPAVRGGRVMLAALGAVNQ